MPTKTLDEYLKQTPIPQTSYKITGFYKEEDFQETLIGKIPKEWRIAKLNDVSLRIKSGSTPLKKRKDYWNGNFPFVTISDMSRVKKYLYDTKEKITDSAIKNTRLLSIPVNNVLLSMYGTIGKVVINKVPVTISQNIAAIIPNKNIINYEFLYYALYYYSFQYMKAKIITLRHLDIRMVKNTAIPLPSLEEQWGIAEVLSAVDNAIEKTEELIGKLERIKQALMNHLLTKGMGHREYKDTPIGKIPKEWKIVKLKDVTKLIRNGLTYKVYNKEGKGYPVTRIETIANEKIDTSKVAYVENIAKKDAEKYRLEKGDILFSHINSVEHLGKVALYEGKPKLLLHGMNLLLIRLDKKEVVPTFMLYLFKYYRIRSIFKSIAKRAVNQASINQSQLGNLQIFLPPLEEQIKIATILQTVDHWIENERKRKERFECLKRGLMELLLTGKIRVRVDKVKRSSMVVSG